MTRVRSRPLRRSAKDCGPNGEPEPRTLAEVVRAYRANHALNAAAERRFYRDEFQSLSAAVSAAARALDRDGKRHSHQRRIPGAILRRCEQALLATLSEIRRSRTFDALHAVIDETIGDIQGVGELMVYDTSTRVGAYLGLRPRAIYMHAGVRVGAKALGLQHQAKRIPITELPSPLNRALGDDAEDMLCIYKSSPAFLNYGRTRGSAE